MKELELREIRVGNYVTGSFYSENNRARCICYDDLEFIFLYDPIPLTEEWLFKLGFHDDGYEQGFIGIDVGMTNFVLSYPKTYVEHCSFFCWNYKQKRIPRYRELKYVHQLQNLYFALTGEELKKKSNDLHRTRTPGTNKRRIWIF